MKQAFLLLNENKLAFQSMVLNSSQTGTVRPLFTYLPHHNASGDFCVLDLSETCYGADVESSCLVKEQQSYLC